MTHLAKSLAAGAALGLALSGCASRGGLSDEQKLALYRDHAGAPVAGFDHHGSINGWTPLGDEAIAVWTRPNQAWLLELFGPCIDLPYSPTITITDLMGRVSARFDKVITLGRGSMQVPCTIREIRPLDVKAIKQAEKLAREQPVTEPGVAAPVDDAPPDPGR